MGAEPRPTARGMLAAHAPAVVAITLAIAVYAAPLLARLTTAFPGTANDRDVVSLIWDVDWLARAAHGEVPWLQSDAVFVPMGADLRLHAYAPLPGLLAFPLAATWGVLAAFNAIVVGTLWLNAVAFYALIARLSGSRAAALAAGVWGAFSLPLLAHVAVGRPAFASLWIVALALLALERVLARPSPWNALALGLLLAAALFTDIQVLLFAALWLALYGLAWLVRERRALTEPRRLAALGGAGLIVLAPFALVYLPAFGRSDVARPGLDTMVGFSFRWWDYVTPGGIPYAYGYELFVAAVAALALWRGRGATRFWLLAAGAFLLLALGPYLQPWRIPLPFAVLSLWPPLRQFRAPGRLTMPAALGLAVVAGFVLAALFARLRSRRVAGALAALLVAARVAEALWLQPLHVQAYPDYAFYHRLAREPGAAAVLEVPFGVRSGFDRIGQGGEVLQYYQIVHHKPLLDAMIARVPDATFAAYRAHSALLFLTGTEVVTATAPELDADFAGVLRWTQAGTVLVHRGLLAPPAGAAIEAFLARQPELRADGAEDDLVIYRVAVCPP